MKTPPRLYYIASGNVRGDCPHRHQTIAAAWACVEKDRRQCSRLGGRSYSDRVIWAVEDGRERGLTPREDAEFEALVNERENR